MEQVERSWSLHLGHLIGHWEVGMLLGNGKHAKKMRSTSFQILIVVCCVTFRQSRSSRSLQQLYPRKNNRGLGMDCYYNKGFRACTLVAIVMISCGKLSSFVRIFKDTHVLIHSCLSYRRERRLIETRSDWSKQAQASLALWIVHAKDEMQCDILRDIFLFYWASSLPRASFKRYWLNRGKGMPGSQQSRICRYCVIAYPSYPNGQGRCQWFGVYNVIGRIARGTQISGVVPMDLKAY